MDDIDYTGLGEYRRKQLCRFPASHHGAPLTYYPQRHVKNILGGSGLTKTTVILDAYCDAAKTINKRLGGTCQVSDDPTTAYLYFLTESLMDGHDSTTYPVRFSELQTCISLAMDDLHFDLKAIKKYQPALENLDKMDFDTQTNVPKLACRLSRGFNAKSALESIRNLIQRNHMKGEEKLMELQVSQAYRVWIVREMVLFVDSANPTDIILLNYDQILMLYDTISCRLMTRLAVELNDELKTDNLPTWDLVKKVYEWGDNVLANYHQHGYSVIGEFESIVTGIFVNFKGSDPLLLGESFLESILETAKENEIAWGVPQSCTIDLLNLLSNVESVNWLSEIFGLRKHWGNPMVDAKASGKAVQEKVDEVLPVSGSGLIRLLASFNRMITLEFIKQHGKWPKGAFSANCADIPLKRAFMNNVCRVPETSPDHQHEHWALFKFDCNCLIDSYEDDLNLLSDKSVSVYKSHLDTVYVRKLCSVKVPDNIPENRRLMLEYLRKKHLSIMDIFKIVMSGSIPDEWLANCASMKGTEMKYFKARIFAVLTYELRQYFAATEDILKESLFRYNPHQTMTLSETDLLSKLREVTRQLDPMAGVRHLSVIHIVDFSKWNLRMRYSNTSGVFKSIDDFLGTPGLIEQTHWVFSDMTNVVQDPFNPPPDGVAKTENETVWRNHGCGWEGQRQKGWTILTSALLSDIARVTGVNSTICGQGDNQALLSQFPVPDRYKNPSDWIAKDPEGVRAVLDNFYKILEDECLQIGLKIKTAETCRSLSFFNYGKRLYFNGVELSMTLKRISKDITEPNDSYPTSEAILKTFEGSSLASSLYSHPSPIPYLIGKIAVNLHVCNAFNKNQLVGNTGIKCLARSQIRFTKKFLSHLTKIPASLGGIPQLSLASYLFRGHPDPLCTDIVMLKIRASNGCVISQKILTVAINGIWFNRHKSDKESLIMAPYSLNLNVPLSARVPLEKEIAPALRMNCHNPKISDMFSANMDSLNNRLISALSTITPFQPLIANDLYSRSPPGRKQALITGLANTTSLGRLLYESHSTPMISKICALEQQQLETWIARAIDVSFQKPDLSYLNKAHHEIAQELRDKSWNTDVQGVTVPHPLEQFVLTKAESGVCGPDCQRYRKEHIVIVRHREEIISLPGADSLHVTSHRSRVGNPYLGSSISEGIIQKQVTCLNPDATWRDIIRLNTIRKWICEKGSELDSLIWELIHMRTDVSDETINNATGEPSRVSYNHRASLQSVVHTCNVGSTTNMHSRLYLSSNKMGEYSHGDSNYHMPFGPVFLCMQELLCLEGIFAPDSWSSLSRVVYHAHVRKDDIPVVFDENMDLSKPSKLRSVKVPDIIFAHSDKMHFDRTMGSPSEEFWSSCEDASRRDARFGYSYQLIADSFVKETIIREMITLNHFEGYPSRPAPISIGDIGLAGLQTLLQALSWHFFLLSPMSLWLCRESDDFSVRAHGFLSCFSSRFWNNFSVPMSNGRLRETLFQMYPSLLVPHATRTYSALNPVLINAVLIEMIKIKENLSTLIDMEKSYSPYALYAPSIASLKLLYSKYVEFCIFEAMMQSNLHERICFDYSRDFASNVLAISDDNFLAMTGRIRLDSAELFQKFKVQNKCIPAIKFYSLQFPWVDKLRSSTVNPTPQVNDTLCRVPKFYPELSNKISFSIPTKPVMIDISNCDCMAPERKNTYHTECYFSRSGLMSKSHLKFLDIIYSLHLDIFGVLVLGSATGTEALAIASHLECHHVYVNCFIKLGDFSQHIAGDYVPSAFSQGKHMEKLVRPSEAVTANSDLLLRETISDILAHTDGYQFSGITCDAEFPDQDNRELTHQLLSNLCSLIQRRMTVQWLIVKIPSNCHHNVVKCLGILSCMFQQLHVVKSPFSRPGTTLIYLVGMIRRERVDFDNLSHNVDQVPSTLLEGNDIERLIRSQMMSRICNLFMTPRLETAQRMVCNQTMESSFHRACHTYIPGWGLTGQLMPRRDTVYESLRIVRKTIERRIVDLLGANYRAHRQEQMPRNMIFQTDIAPLNRRLNQLYGFINRIELLQELLKTDILDIEKSIEYLNKWIVSDHVYKLKERVFRLELSASFFVNKLSRPLYEILGHIYKSDFQIGTRYQGHYLYHRDYGVEFTREIDDLLVSLPFSNIILKPNRSWKWARRCEILTWMLGYHLLQNEIFVVDTKYDYVLDELHSHSYLMKIQARTPDSERVDLVVVNDWNDIIDYLSANLTPRFVRIPVGMCNTLSTFFTLINFWKVPWSGLVPDEVLVEVTRRDLPDWGSSNDQFPDFNFIRNACNPIGYKFVECSCWDCSVEAFLVSRQQITHSALNLICSLKQIETVLDQHHVL